LEIFNEEERGCGSRQPEPSCERGVAVAQHRLEPEGYDRRDEEVRDVPRRPAHALDVSEVVEQVDADARLARRGERELRAEPSRRELAAGEEAAVGEADAVVRAKGVGQQGRRDGAVGQQLRRGRVDWSKVGGGWGEICGQRDEKNDDDGGATATGGIVPGFDAGHSRKPGGPKPISRYVSSRRRGSRPVYLSPARPRTATRVVTSIFSVLFWFLRRWAQNTG
jgi:hypothetical protein